MKKNIRTGIIITISFLLFSGLLPAQDKSIFNNSKHKIGFITGYGGRNVKQLMDPDFAVNNYYYTVVFFQLQYYYTVWAKKSFGVDILLQPQYNITEFKYFYRSSDTTKGFELGLNFGLLIRMNTHNDLFSFYFFLSTGPQYIPDIPKRQASGFIFSNNVFLGMNIRIFKNVYLDIRPGFRHISNLNLELPNYGINNLVISGGLMYVFKPKARK